jgi:hypothetical protein
MPALQTVRLAHRVAEPDYTVGLTPPKPKPSAIPRRVPGIAAFAQHATTARVSLYTHKSSCYCFFPYRHSSARRLGL